MTKIRVTWTYEFDVNPTFYMGLKTDAERLDFEKKNFDLGAYLDQGTLTFELMNERSDAALKILRQVKEIARSRTLTEGL